MKRTQRIQKYYAQRASHYDEQKARTWDSTQGFGSAILSSITNTISELQKGIVLEVAIGSGRVAYPLLQGSPVTYLGVDLSYDMIKQAVVKLNPFQARLHLLVSEATQLPFRKVCFQKVVCISALHYFDSPETQIAFFAQLLKPGGSFLYGDLILHEEDTDRFFDQLEHLLTPPHHRYYRPTELLQTLVDSGFLVEQVEIIPYTKSYTALHEDKSSYFHIPKKRVLQFVHQATPKQKSLYNLQEDQMTLYYAVVISTKK
ncbi:MAG: class I SAM-dependent methyltransferase [Candidatus Ranarchaeia archaeon]|jgi:ubiquinone/menaquinone biosynthesis C-methylase UbiE